MARQTLTKTQLGGYYPTSLTAVTFTAADATNKEQFVADSENIVLAWNTGAGARTVTVTSSADPITGRTGDITAASLAAGTIKAFRIRQTGWLQSGGDAGKVFLEASHAEILWAVLTP